MIRQRAISRDTDIIDDVTYEGLVIGSISDSISQVGRIISDFLEVILDRGVVIGRYIFDDEEFLDFSINFSIFRDVFSIFQSDFGFGFCADIDLVTGEEFFGVIGGK